ncbi:MAG: tetratricopeptide repeat protein [Spirulinaceae cyanobacterium]
MTEESAGSRVRESIAQPGQPELEPWSPAAEETLNDLIRALRRKKGFGLFFVQCAVAMEQAVIVSVHERLPHKKVTEFILNQESETLYVDLLNLYQAEGLEIAFITGLEKTIYKYESVKELAGWSPQEIYSYSWKDVPPLMSHLNRQRESFEQNLPISLIFVVESYIIDYFVRRAPDFFDWRSGLFKLFQTDEAFYTSVEALLIDYHRDDNVLNYLECTRRILELKKSIQRLSDDRADEKSKLLREQGRYFAMIGDEDEALECYNRALKENPENYHVFVSRGQLLYSKDEYKIALADYDRAINLSPELQPELQTVWHYRGMALEALQEREQAVESYRFALNADPENMDGWYRRGKLLRELKRYEAAIENFDEALKLAPEAEDFWYLKSVSHNDLDQKDIALSAIKKALHINPQNVAYLYHQGMIFKDLENYTAAIESFDRAIAIKPYESKLWCIRGLVMGMSGDHEAAKESLKRSVLLNPRAPDSLKMLLNAAIQPGDQPYTLQ